jgi:peptide-methionine (S)-S-oxide reductase
MTSVVHGEAHLMSTELQKAAFGAGCFWHVEVAFRKAKGVVDTAVGYMGGHLENPSYEDVHSGTTGHAETVEVTYDPGRTSYEDLLDLFWEIHDPTTVNRQGPDVGHQYRSVIFYYDEEQRKEAERSKHRLQGSGKYSQDIVTEIVHATRFWRAEEYHQRYLEKHGLAVCPL